MSHREVMPAEEQHLFANALRAYLGLGPLYGEADKPRACKVKAGHTRRRRREAGAATTEEVVRMAG